MVLEIVTSIVLLFGGIAVLVIIHVCIAGRTYWVSQGSSESSAVMQRSSTMSDEDIKKLPWFDYKLDQEDDAEEVKRADCAVCLEGFKDGDKCRLLPNCKHTFHACCIDSWLIKTAACPVCRTCVDLRRSSNEESRFSNDVCLELTL